MHGCVDRDTFKTIIGPPTNAKKSIVLLPDGYPYDEDYEKSRLANYIMVSIHLGA